MDSYKIYKKILDSVIFVKGYGVSVFDFILPIFIL